MKFLNKIVFINSARIPYGEAKLDGNVHFTGTQGVGKSTILRAILFFYNADKTKLGISKEKKSFDEYYFPQANSYIIYEVKNEESAYCVMAFRGAGRVCFRFIDGAFRREAFVNQQGEAYSNWSEINKQLGSEVGHTAIIDRYELYRDVLYGNFKATKASFRKYALLQSNAYQNIPRTIHNVFLNTKLDAEFIKQTIIHSMGEEELVIDLEKQKHHIESINAQLRDLSVWRESDRLGNSLMMLQADKIIGEWRLLLTLEKQREELAQTLNGAYRQAQAREPQLKESLSGLQRNRSLLNDEKQQLQRNYETLSKELAGVVSVAKDQVKRAKGYAAEYQTKGIEELERAQACKAEWELQQASLTEQQRTLKSQADSLQARYGQLLQQKENELVRFENAKQEQRNRLEKERMEQEAALNQDFGKQHEELRLQREKELEELNTLVKGANEQLTQLQLQRVRIKERQPLAAEQEQLKTNQATWERELQGHQHQYSLLQKEIESERLKGEMEQQRLQQASQPQQNEAMQRIAQLEQQLEPINRWLESYKGSFCEWLETEMPNWQQQIGKVIDESVLYHRELNPKRESAVVEAAKAANSLAGTLFEDSLGASDEALLTASNATLFGVKINLEQLPQRTQSVADLQEQREALLQELQAAKQLLATLQQELEQQLERIRKESKAKISGWKKRLQEEEYQVGQKELRIREGKVERIDLERKAAELKERELAEMEQQLAAAMLQLKEQEGAVEARKVTFEGLMEELKSAQQTQLQQIQRQGAEQLAQLQQQLEDFQVAKRAELEALKAEELAAFAKEGVDIERLQQIEQQLTDVTGRLQQLEENRSLLEIYRGYKREWIDKLPTFQAALEAGERKQAQERKAFELEQGKVEQQLQELLKTIKAEELVLSELERNLAAVARFKESSNFQEIASIVEERSSEELCERLIERLQANFQEESKGMNRLTEQSRRLTQRLSSENRFGFATNPLSKSELFQLADQLDDFREGNKLDAFEKELQEQFGMVLQTYAQEIGTLLAKEGEVQRIINDINQDFVKNGGFTTVIKKIQLRRVESQNPIVHLLQRIYQFSTNQAGELGQRTLFSSGEMNAANAEAVELLVSLSREVNKVKSKQVSLSDAFDLQFQIIENDNDSGWVEHLANVGSEGTDILVKAMINIMLLNVFKEKASRKSGEFKLHCMMDEIGKLHPNNVKGILEFARKRNILLINGSPISQRATDYKYTYQLNKDAASRTRITQLIRIGKAKEQPVVGEQPSIQEVTEA